MLVFRDILRRSSLEVASVRVAVLVTNNFKSAGDL